MLSPVSQTVESQLVSKMCRVKSVGVGTVVVDVEPAGAETDTHAGVDAPLQSLRTADFALQLVSMLLILLFLTLALYIAYKRRRLMKMKRYSDFGTHGRRSGCERGSGQSDQGSEQPSTSGSHTGT